jgi:hypothetical protein
MLNKTKRVGHRNTYTKTKSSLASLIVVLFFVHYYSMFGSQDSLVCIARGYGLDGHSSIPGRSKDFSVLHSIHIGSEAHPASYPVSTRAFSLEGKAARA